MVPLKKYTFHKIKKVTAKKNDVTLDVAQNDVTLDVAQNDVTLDVAQNDVIEYADFVFLQLFYGDYNYSILQTVGT